MAKFSLPRIALSAGIVFGAATIASAQDSGALLNLLSRKGIITDQEAEELRAELTSEFAANTPAGKLDISSGITKLRIAGDLRVRYQYDNEQANPAGTNNNQDRSRYRYRFRLGTTATLGSKWTAGLRFESNGGATSTNNDFGSGTDNFSKTTDGVNLGQVFIQYNDTGVFGSDALDIRVGKFGHKFFNPGVNGFWIDSDINFEGLAEEIVYGGLIDGWKTSLRAGQFILNANSTAGADANDPSLLLIGQVEFANKQWKIAPTFVGFAAPSAHDASANTPALQASDTAVYTDLATFLLPVEFSTAFAGRPLAVYATYGINLEGEARARRLAQTRNVDDDVTIANVGVRYGAAKIPGEYQLTAEYRHVGNGSYSSLLLDSDFNGGYLNGKGFILSGTYAITEAISATATYFNAFNIEGDRPAGGSTNRGDGFGKAQVLQIDLSAKF
jgi:Campylobacter major outer membrane protein.